MTMAEEPELEEYEEIEDEQPVVEADAGAKQGYVQAVSFDDMQLKRELLRAVQDAGFEHPSEIQQQCIPVALQGQDVIGQAKSGMGKTAVFVLGVLHQLEPETGKVAAVVLSHTRELAQQIEAEFKRFAKYMDPPVRIGMVVGGIAIKLQMDMLADEAKRPHIIIGTPGRTLDLVNKKKLILDHIKYFIVDECDKVLDAADMRQDVQRIFMACPRKKQVMMYSATMSDEMRTILHKFTTRPAERKIEERGLVLEGLVQHYRLVSEADKMKELMDLLDNLDFNQVIIFVKSTQRANALAGVLKEAKFPVEVLHGSLKMPQRQEIMRKFKEQPNDARILVSTDLVSRGVDVERVNVVINFDMPETSSEKGSGVDTYLHRVGRAGRFGTRGIAITFVSSKEETDILNEVQTRFDVAIEALPDINTIDKSTYSNA